MKYMQCVAETGPGPLFTLLQRYILHLHTTFRFIIILYMNAFTSLPQAEPLRTHCRNEPPIAFVRRTEGKLSEKFAEPPGGFPTDAVFTADVDMFYTCHALQL